MKTGKGQGQSEIMSGLAHQLQAIGDINPTLATIPYYILTSARPITLVELGGGMMTCLHAVMKTGSVIEKYVYCDVDTKLHAIIPTLLQRFSE